MVAFLSDGWIDEMDRAARSSASLRRACAEVTMVVEQRIVGGDDDDGNDDAGVTYHLVFDRGQVAVRPGPAPAPTVRFCQDRRTAEAISSGAMAAQQAFMARRLRIDGDLRALLAHADLLAGLDDVFAPVRAATDHDPGDQPEATPRPRGA